MLINEIYAEIGKAADPALILLTFGQWQTLIRDHVVGGPVDPFGPSVFGVRVVIAPEGVIYTPRVLER